MKIWVFEDNLMWSSRLQKSLASMGHEAVVSTEVPDAGDPADAAFVNLSSQRIRAADLVPALKAMGVPTIGFAGHKEKELLELGGSLGCDVLATNSEITFKLDRLMTRVFGGDRK